MIVQEARLLLAIQANSSDEEELSDIHQHLFQTVPSDMDAARDLIGATIPSLPPEKVVSLWNRIGFQTVWLTQSGEISPVPEINADPVLFVPQKQGRAYRAKAIGYGHCVILAESMEDAIEKFWKREGPKVPSNCSIRFDEIILKDGVETSIYGV